MHICTLSIFVDYLLVSPARAHTQVRYLLHRVIYLITWPTSKSKKFIYPVRHSLPLECSVLLFLFSSCRIRACLAAGGVSKSSVYRDCSLSTIQGTKLRCGVLQAKLKKPANIYLARCIDTWEMIYRPRGKKISRHDPYCT